MNDELKHYGVKGMRWGVRRASKQLTSSKSSEGQKRKAAESLQKHRAKATKKVSQLEKQRPKLEDKSNKYAMKNDIKAQNLKQKAAKKNKKAYGMFVSKNKADKLFYQADKLNVKADSMIAKSQEAKAKVAKNEALTSMYKQGISSIDKVLLENGRKYING